MPQKRHGIWERRTGSVQAVVGALLRSPVGVRRACRFGFRGWSSHHGLGHGRSVTLQARTRTRGARLEAVVAGRAVGGLLVRLAGGARDEARAVTGLAGDLPGLATCRTVFKVD